ncbi:MAG TPA: R3H domain-containing nucleic acid-binding protein [Candidatus Saccharimonadales bacterium]|nr:R3H domain-containing nucleic acid-binding protein [Candidatus Saccharimonadales bacterium]
MNQDEAITFAKQYLENLLSFFGLNTSVNTSCDDEVIELQIPSTHLNGFLIGQHGDTLRSLQYLVSMALKNSNASIDRVNIDVADYKKHRAERLATQVQDWSEQVRSSKQKMELRPMSPADRRVVHQTVGEYSDLKTESVGEGRDRRVVIHPADQTDQKEPASEEPTTEAVPEEE